MTDPGSAELPEWLEAQSFFQSESVDALVGALVLAQSAYDAVRKDRNNTFFNASYATLGSVLDATVPHLSANGLVLVQQTLIREGKHVLWSRVIHTSGQYFGSLWVLRPMKDDPQGHGSALTYARRYQAQVLLGVAPEDDDGNAASQPAQRQQRAQQSEQPADSSRNWSAEIGALISSDQSLDKQVESLRNLMGECERTKQMTPNLRKKFIAEGKALNVKIEAAKPQAANE